MSESTLRSRRAKKEGTLAEAPASDESSCSDSAASNDDVGRSSITSFDTKSAQSPSSVSSIRQFLPLLGLLVWPGMLALPLFFNSSRWNYAIVFPRAWYAMRGQNWLSQEIYEGGTWEWGTARLGRPMRHPLGLSLGILAVAVGHVFLMIYFRLHQQQLLGKTTPIQSRGAPDYVYFEALKKHLCQPGGFLLLGIYLTATWVFDLLPHSYYSFEGGIQYTNVLLCLICQDGVSFLMHLMEHVAHPKVYQLSHKPHHKFTNPKLFDAYDGSLTDTTIMMLTPLFITAHVVRTCNVWTYMAFGSTYANWLTLLHSEIAFPWDPYFRAIGFGTSADHHIHHKFFKYNFSHLFMWFDMLAGTYRNPSQVWGKEFNNGV